MADDEGKAKAKNPPSDSPLEKGDEEGFDSPFPIVRVGASAGGRGAIQSKVERQKQGR